MTALELLSKGFLLGVTLSFMVGPLLFALTETSLTHGPRAGLAIAAGMWAGDVAFIFLIIYGVDWLAAVAAWPNFRAWAGAGGGCILCLFGLASFFSSKKDARRAALAELDLPKKKSKRMLRFWLKGLIFNMVNPGTLFFWLGITTALVIPNHWTVGQTTTFFGVMMLTLILTDCLKVLAAKRLRKFLTPGHVLQIRMGIGLVLLGLGLYLVWEAVSGRLG